MCVLTFAIFMWNINTFMYIRKYKYGYVYHFQSVVLWTFLKVTNSVRGISWSVHFHCSERIVLLPRFPGTVAIGKWLISTNIQSVHRKPLPAVEAENCIQKALSNVIDRHTEKEKAGYHPSQLYRKNTDHCRDSHKQTCICRLRNYSSFSFFFDKHFSNLVS